MHTNLTPQAGVTKLRYGLQLGPDGLWIIVNAKDERWAWCGGCWVDRDSTSHLMRFLSPELAEEYCAYTFPLQQEEPHHAHR